MARDISESDAAHCLDVVRNGARDFYLADLLLPDTIRTPIVTLHAFHVEITNVSLSGSDPMAAQIRLQWWAEVIDGQRRQEAAGHPVARSLLATIEKYDLPPATLKAKVEAHIFDLYNDPMGDRTMLEGYCGETRSILFQLAGIVAGGTSHRELADASGHAGVAQGITVILLHLARSRQFGRVYIPSNVLLASQLTASEFLSSTHSGHLESKIEVIRQMIELARHHHTRAEAAVVKLPVELRLLFKPLALVPLYLTAIEKKPRAVFDRPANISQLRKQWALWRY